MLPAGGGASTFVTGNSGSSDVKSSMPFAAPVLATKIKIVVRGVSNWASMRSALITSTSGHKKCKWYWLSKYYKKETNFFKWASSNGP
jgi:hypothetical protein